LQDAGYSANGGVQVGFSGVVCMLFDTPPYCSTRDATHCVVAVITHPLLMAVQTYVYPH
jgi:hypothetical protein